MKALLIGRFGWSQPTNQLLVYYLSLTTLAGTKDNFEMESADRINITESSPHKIAKYHQKFLKK